MHNKHIVSLIKSLTLLTCLFLFACNEEASDTNTEDIGSVNNTPLTLSAQDADDATKLSPNQYYVDLSKKVVSSEGDSAFYIAEVTSLSADGNCQVIEQKSQGFSVKTTDPMACIFEYTAAPIAGKSGYASSALSRVVVTNDPSGSTALPPLSKTTSETQLISINLTEELSLIGATLEPGFILSEDVASDQTNSGALITVDVANNNISYTPAAGFSGLERLFYSYSDENSNVLTGQIDIATSLVAKSGIEANDYGVVNTAVEINSTNNVLDLSQFVTSVDANWQVTDAYSFYATVSPYDNNDVQNKMIQMDFPSKVGLHYVTYVVTDHRGSFDTGMLEVKVEDPLLSATWENIESKLSYFFGPLTKSEADSAGVAYTSSNFDANGANVPTFSFLAANKSCGNGRRLPTTAELLDLRAVGNGIGPAAYAGWPDDIGYWASDEGMPVAIDLSPAATALDGKRPAGYYVTCSNSADFYIDEDSSTFTAVANGIDPMIFAVQLTFNESGLANKQVTAAINEDIFLNSQAVLSSTSEQTDAEGRVYFSLTDIKKEGVMVDIAVNGVVVSQRVDFEGDAATAEISAHTAEDIIIPDPEDIRAYYHSIWATLNDVNGNTVAGQTIIFTAAPGDEDKILIEPNWPSTNSIGQQLARVYWIGGEIETDQLVNVIVEFVRPDGSVESQEIQLLFAAPGAATSVLITGLDKMALGTTSPYIATVTYDNGLTRTVSDVVWNVDETSGYQFDKYVKISPTGVVTAIAVGRGQINVSYTDNYGKTVIDQHNIEVLSTVENNVEGRLVFFFEGKETVSLHLQTLYKYCDFETYFIYKDGTKERLTLISQHITLTQPTNAFYLTYYQIQRHGYGDGVLKANTTKNGMSYEATMDVSTETGYTVCR